MLPQWTTGKSCPIPALGLPQSAIAEVARQRKSRALAGPGVSDLPGPFPCRQTNP
jgi:hypothetical protein